MREFKLARAYAIKKDRRNYVFGAVAKRADGAMVYSRNIPNCEKNNLCHAETRISRKLDVGSTVWVVKVSRSTGQLKNARPCPDCERNLRSSGVKRCYYSISESEFGVLEF